MSTTLNEFSQGEYERRLDVLQRSLAQHAIDGLLIVDEANYRYVTGHATEAWKNPSRRRACWITRDALPALVVPPGEGAEVRARSPWEDVHEFDGPSTEGPIVAEDLLLGFEPDLTAAIIDTGRRLGLDQAERLAIAKGGWSQLDLPLGVLESVQQGLGVIAWIDAAPLLWEARMVKSEAEIEYMRLAVRVLDEAFVPTFTSIEAGMTELEIARAMRANILHAGADHDGYTIAVADVRRGRAVGAAPGAWTVEPGNLMMIDAGAIVRGYTSDYSRMAVLGKPTATQSAAYELVFRAYCAGVDTVRAGALVADVTRAMHRVLADSTDGASPIGRMGHGTGLEVPEPPSLHLAAESVLKEGMILCIEPNIRADGVGTLIVEDVIVVRAGGGEHLSAVPTPPELMSV
jgi:Xaa-Pro aminopeptidase